MKLFRLLLTLLSVALPVTARAKVTRLAATNRARLEAATRVELLRRVRDVPAAVLAACAPGPDSEFELADPGRAYQATDVIDSRRNLPRRRLRWAARLPGLYVLHYEHGGIGHSYHVLLIRVSGGASSASAPARLAWAAVSDAGFRDYGGFVGGLRAGTLDDQLAYGR